MKLKIIVSLIMTLSFDCLAKANICNSYLLNSNTNKNSSSNYPENLAHLLYPRGDDEVIKFTTAFFNVLVNHKVSGPFLGMKGPSGVQYSLDKNKFAFLVNDNDETADLVVFNWLTEPADGFEIHTELSVTYGSRVYVFKGLRKKQIITSPALNFSYILGSDYIETQLLNSGMDVVPNSFKNFKPQPNYLDRNHSLRTAIGQGSLPLFSPKQEYIFNVVPHDVRSFFEETLQAQGGYIYKILGMILHETYHLVEGEAGVKKLISAREIHEDRAKVVGLLKTSEEVQSLVAAYIKIVFSIADNFANANVTETDLAKLVDLKSIIKVLKVEFPEVWNIIWIYEYAEGFAEYVAAESLISTSVISIQDNVSFEKADGNSFPYRTGTFAGLFMRFKLGKILFSNDNDHIFSPWELIINNFEELVSEDSVEGTINKYANYPINAEDEILEIIEYLNSSETDF